MCIRMCVCVHVMCVCMLIWHCVNVSSTDCLCVILCACLSVVLGPLSSVALQMRLHVFLRNRIRWASVSVSYDFGSGWQSKDIVQSSSKLWYHVKITRFEKLADDLYTQYPAKQTRRTMNREYTITPCHAIQYHTIQYHTTSIHVQFHVALCDATIYHTAQHHTKPFHTMPCQHTMPHQSKHYHTMPFHTIPNHTIPLLLSVMGNS